MLVSCNSDIFFLLSKYFPFFLSKNQPTSIPLINAVVLVVFDSLRFKSL